MAKPKKKSYRPHGALPAGFEWRDGRPRWNPSPSRRALGWKKFDLRDEAGAFLDEGAAIMRCREIAAAVEGWAKNHPIPESLRAIAPSGAPVAAPAKADPRSIGAMLERYYKSDLFTKKKPNTQRDYRNKISRLIRFVAKVSEADHANKRIMHRENAEKIAAARLLPMAMFTLPPFNEDGESEIAMLQQAHNAIAEESGVAMANGVVAAAGAWFAYCVNPGRLWRENPANSVSRPTIDGRIVIWEPYELRALIAAADAEGEHSIADAVILALDLSWSQQDILALTWDQIRESLVADIPKSVLALMTPSERQAALDQASRVRVKGKRIKTGQVGNPPLLQLGRRRLKLIRQRHATKKIQSPLVIYCESPKVANRKSEDVEPGRWLPDHFRHRFSEIRAIAAKKAPSLATKQFRDLRDTAITMAIDAQLTDDEIRSRSLHAKARLAQIIEKHYGGVGQGITDGAADKIDAHYERNAITIDPLVDAADTGPDVFADDPLDA